MGFVEVMSLADNPGYDTVPLFREKLCVMTVSDHPLVGKSNITMSDFENCGFAFTYEDCCFTAQFRKELEAQGGKHCKRTAFGQYICRYKCR